MARIDDLSESGKMPRGALPVGKLRAGRLGAVREELGSRKRPHRGLGDEELKKRIGEQAKELIASPSATTLNLYRELIAEVIERAVDEGMEVRSEASFTPDPKVFTSITRVNARLLDLAEEVRKSEENTIRIAHIVEEIKGLVADLLG